MAACFTGGSEDLRINNEGACLVVSLSVEKEMFYFAWNN